MSEAPNFVIAWTGGRCKVPIAISIEFLGPIIMRYSTRLGPVVGVMKLMKYSAQLEGLAGEYPSVS